MKPTETKTPAPPSIVASDCRITGNLKSDGEIQIDGVVEGDIHATTLLVGETAAVNGQVIAETVLLHGRLSGEIQAKRVSLSKTAHVVGDIMHEELSIETGAFLEGRCTRLEFVQALEMSTLGNDNAKAGSEVQDQSKTSGVTEPAREPIEMAEAAPSTA